MFFRCRILAVSCLMLAICGTTSVAVPIPAPTSLNPGDQYRLAFLTSTTRDALSTDIADYNAFVTADANSQAELAALGVSWFAIGSTASVDARDNTGTNPNSSAGVPIFLLNDTQLADNNADLWDGSIGVTFNVRSDGSLASAAQLVWTGSVQNGTADADFPLGDGFAANQGVAGQTGQLWIEFFPAASNLPFPLYAISDVLSVAIPEPSTLALLGIGTVGLMGHARGQQRRKKAAASGANSSAA